MKFHVCNHAASGFLLVAMVAALTAPHAANAQPASLEVESSYSTGNAARRFRSFDEAASVEAAPTTVSLQVTSHANNVQVGSGATLVQGRTAPDAFVDVKVRAGMNQQVSTQRVQADANGNFSFSFTPQMPLPGTRYEVNIVATHGNVRAEATLVLFQRQG